MAQSIDGYDINMADPLGRGTFGTVYAAKFAKTGRPVAAKQIIIMSNEKQKLQIESEIKNVSELSHPNIVSYLHNKRVDNVLWLFLELCDLGSLDKYFQETNPEKQESLQLMTQMTTAVAFLHAKKIVHRDIKPANILLSTCPDLYPIVKIADLGLSKAIYGSDLLSFTTKKLGSTKFRAPELNNRDDRSDKAVDIFSLGLTFLSMICYKKGNTKLLPDEDPSSNKDIGYRMFFLLKEGKLDEAIAYENEIVKCHSENEKYDKKFQTKIRSLILKMIRCRSEQRIDAQAVREEIATINDLQSNDVRVQLQEYQKDSVTIFNYGSRIDAVLHNMSCAATVVDDSWDESRVKIKVWNYKNHGGWSERNLDVEHKLNQNRKWSECDHEVEHKSNEHINKNQKEWSERDQGQRSPDSVAVFNVLEKKLLLIVRIRPRCFYFLLVNSFTGKVLDESRVLRCYGFPSYSNLKYQILLPDRVSSSIVQLDAHTFENIYTWADERVKKPWRVSSNRNRAAVENFNKSIAVFKLVDKQLSHEIIYIVKFRYFCSGSLLLSDNTLMAMDWRGWSVWSEKGSKVHSSVKHPSLFTWEKAYPYPAIQDPLSEDWFVQEYGKQNDNDCTVIYDMKIVTHRLKTGDRSQVKHSELKMNKTIKFRFKR